MSSTPVLPQRRFFGPFQLLIRICGLDLSSSIFNYKQAKQDGTQCRAIFFTLTTVIIMVVLIMDVISVTHTEADSYSLEWLRGNLRLGMVLHGTASAGYLAIITAKQAFRGLEQRYGTLSQRAPSNTRMRAVMLTVVFIFTILLMLVVVSNAADDTSTWIKAGSPVNFGNLWGADPFIRIFCGLFSCLATIIYILAFGGITQQFRGFNEEIKAIAEGETTFEGLIAISQRQKELLSMLRYTNETFGRFVTLGVIGSMIAHANAMAILFGFRSSLTGGEIALMTGFLLITGNLMGSLLLTPAMLDAQVQEISDIFLFKSSIGTSKNETLLPIVNHMIERAKAKENRLCFLHAFYLDLTTAHRLMLVMLPLGNLLVLFGHIYGVQK